MPRFGVMLSQIVTLFADQCASGLAFRLNLRSISGFIVVSRSHDDSLGNHVMCKIHVSGFSIATLNATSLRNRYYIHAVCIFRILSSALFAPRYDPPKTELHGFFEGQH